ncbi:MAG: cell division protein FtsQ [Psychrosphaera sp.]|mgnify:CR=1 FL=1|jgi:cell division protein FtsQ|uniref:Cell division protein FtsQ n=1 Tax=Psychrosphaera aquimarina TaxID=2044854 RepID=A0ABU3R0J6_9GAMM|nr:MULTISPECIES: cell division protein FtsQ/DivIB [Psychrosphaera]MBU2916821.1 cell division protein FtsQ/DivIB [Psychrosphaera sp. F3M07]MDU0113200.1 cell division protein FtsQ/DivIB [Psychrosphaera aquimarina]
MVEKPLKKWRHSSFLVGIVFFLTVILFIIWGYNALFDWAQSKNDSPINSVVVHGNFKYLSAEQLEAKIGQKLDGSFFTLDVDRLQNQIEENPWVYSASIRKEWPRKLHVYIVEQEAFAIWNNDLLLNKFGDVFYANGVKVDNTLARLYGPEGNEKDVLKGYVDMQYLLKLHNFKISELVLSERYAWQLWLKSGIHLNLGRSDKMSRVQRFLDLQPLLAEYGNKKIARVDLRYDIGLAVSWQ